jgi:uncharacterized protein involved in outer membrane biogenesis
VAFRRALVRISTVAAVGVLVAAATVATLVVLYPQPLIEWYAAKSLDRRLSFASLKIGWGNPVTIEARDIRLSNASWAPEPDMFRADYLAGELDSDALWQGVLRWRRLRVEKPVVLLERGPDNARNWRFPGSGGPATGFAVVPKTRTQFPILLNFAMRNGAVILRAPGRQDLRIDFYNLGIRAPADDKPAQLTVDGAYNGTALRLTADTDSFVQLRDGTTPFGASVSVATAPGTINFKGSLQEPVDFDGARGTLEVDAQNLGDLLKIFGAGVRAPFPLRFAGPFEKTGDHWQIARGDGHLPAGNFNGDVALDEGGRGQPDAVTMNLAFDRLDATTLLAGTQGSGKPMSLQPDPAPGALFDATIAAQSLVYNQLRLSDVRAHGRTRPGEIALDSMSFKFAGGTVETDGWVRGTDTGGEVALTATAAALDAGHIVEFLGGDKGELSGLLDARLALEMHGDTVADGLKHSRGQAVLAMVQGKVSRDLVERASTNLLTLFRAGEGDAPLSCLVGVAQMTDGVVALGPLRLRTPTTTFLAGGRADLVTDRVELNIRSSGGGVLALKLPLQITGSFQKLDAKPLLGAAPPIRETPDRDLPPGMRGLIEHNACLR